SIALSVRMRRDSGWWLVSIVLASRVRNAKRSASVRSNVRRGVDWTRSPGISCIPVLRRERNPRLSRSAARQRWSRSIRPRYAPWAAEDTRKHPTRSSKRRGLHRCPAAAWGRQFSELFRSGSRNEGDGRRQPEQIADQRSGVRSTNDRLGLVLYDRVPW